MNYDGVMKFLNNQAKRTYGEEAGRLLERRILGMKISQLVGKNEAERSIHKDLLRRIQRLEMAIRS